MVLVCTLFEEDAMNPQQGAAPIVLHYSEVVYWKPLLKGVQTCTMTIYTEAKINRKITRHGIRMHIPRAINT